MGAIVAETARYGGPCYTPEGRSACIPRDGLTRRTRRADGCRNQQEEDEHRRPPRAPQEGRGAAGDEGEGQGRAAGGQGGPPGEARGTSPPRGKGRTGRQ